MHTLKYKITMRKIYTIAAMLLSALGAGAQQLPNKNIAVIENFTNTGCGPCAKFAPVLDKVINDRLGEAICIKCHGNYPDRNDPFYLAEKDNLDKRIALYDISSYPSLILNGTRVNYTLSHAVLNGWIDNLITIDQDYDIIINSDVTDHNLYVEGNVTAHKDVADASNLRLFVVAIEEYYKAESAYSNGEKEMEFVAKRYMPNGDGMAIGDKMEQGKAYDFSFSCDLSTFYDEKELGVVAYVQDMSTKNIVASAYIPKEAKGKDIINLIRVEDTPDFICTPDFFGNITFRNDGENDVKSAKINVELNGTLKTYDWTGSLGRLAREEWAIEDIRDFELTSDGTKNTAKIWLSKINGTDKTSNTITVNFSNSMQAEKAVRLKIYTDKKPQETTWKVFNSAGDVVQQGGPYDKERTRYSEDLMLKTDDCYSLAIYDAGGDGISSTAYGNGYYQLYQVEKDENGEETTKRLTQGTFTNSECDIAFNLKNADSTLGINDVKSSTDKNSTMTVFDESGRILLRTTVGKLTEADMLSVGKGPRIVKINDGEHTYVNKYVINK